MSDQPAASPRQSPTALSEAEPLTEIELKSLRWAVQDDSGWFTTHGFRLLVRKALASLDAARLRADEEGDKVDGLLADRKRLETVLENERGARKVLLDSLNIQMDWRKSAELERDLERAARQQAEALVAEMTPKFSAYDSLLQVSEHRRQAYDTQTRSLTQARGELKEALHLLADKQQALDSAYAALDRAAESWDQERQRANTAEAALARSEAQRERLTQRLESVAFAGHQASIPVHPTPSWRDCQFLACREWRAILTEDGTASAPAQQQTQGG